MRKATAKLLRRYGATNGQKIDKVKKIYYGLLKSERHGTKIWMRQKIKEKGGVIYGSY